MNNTMNTENMNPLAVELNKAISQGNAGILSMLSDLGRQLFFPKGILSQSAEAKEKAHHINATIGIARECGHTMFLESIMAPLPGLDAGDALTYAPAFGHAGLRKLWQDELYRKNPSLQGKPVSLPVVTCGITHGASLIGDIWIDRDDVILVPDKMWGNYANIYSLRRGAKLSSYALFDQRDGYNLDDFEQALIRESHSRKKIVVLLNFPQNPTGYSLSKIEADAVVDILVRAADRGNQIVTILDDAYFGLFYEDETMKESLFAKLCGSHPNLVAIKLDGATKEYFAWGLRVGFITYGIHCQGSPEAVYSALEKKTAGCIRSTISNASHVGQSLIFRAMKDPHHEKEIREKFNLLKSRAQKVKHVLADPKFRDAFLAYPFNSGYFMCLKLASVSAESLRLHLLERYGVGLIALGKHDLRVAFSCIDEEQIPELFDIILRGVQDLCRG